MIRAMGKSMPRSALRLPWAVMLALSASLLPVSNLRAQQAGRRPQQQERSAEQNKILLERIEMLQEEIRLFMDQLGPLATPEPFVRTRSRSEIPEEELYDTDRQKVRPPEGFGHYDIDQLQLVAVIEMEGDEKGTSVIAAVFKSEGKTFIEYVGSEAFDGMITEISVREGCVKFMQRLYRQGPERPDLAPYIEKEKIVRIAGP